VPQSATLRYERAATEENIWFYKKGARERIKLLQELSSPNIVRVKGGLCDVDEKVILK
jgi:hypothetical protein